MKTNENLQQTEFRFFLRELNESFPYKCSPLYKPEHERKIVEWATSFSNIDDKKGLIHTLGCELCCLVASVYPMITTAARYETLCRNFIVQVLVDDHVEESWGKYAPGKSIDNIQKYLLNVINAVECLLNTTPWYKRWWKTFMLYIPGVYPPWVKEVFLNYKQLLQDMPPVLQARCITTFTDFLKAAFVQITWENKSTLLNEEIYLSYRLHCLAAIHCFSLIEYGSDIPLPYYEYNHPIMQQLVTTAAQHVLYVNDLFSGLKEYKGNLETFNNIIGLLVRTKGINIQQAVDEVCLRIEACEASFIKIREEWYASGEVISATSRSYIEGLQYWMAGNLYWSRRSKRYFGPDFNDSVTSGQLTWHPDGAIYTPLAYGYN